MTNAFATTRRGSAVGAFLLLLGAACGYAAPLPDASAGAAPAAAAPEVLARVGDLDVTMADIEELAGPQLRQIEQRRHELVEATLNRAIEEKLIELEAKKRGITEAQLLTQEVEAKSPAVSDADVDAFYEERKAQINQPKEQIAERIKMYLANQRQQEARQKFVDGLRAAYPVKSMVEPIRMEVAADGPAKGPADAPVTIVEFSDFQCPYCSRVVPVIEQVKAKYGDKVRVVFRQFPLNSIHPQAQKAAEASLCANEQGKFWELHDAMFQNQQALGIDQLKAKAKELGIDSAKFDPCVDSGKYAEAVAADLAAGQKAGVSGTPAMFVNGRFLNGAVPFEDVDRIVQDELSRKGVAMPAATASK
jgi:protein-disulfide isomerase